MDSNALAEALELGNLVLPPARSQAEFLTLPGMVVRSSTIPSPFVNLAGRLRLAAATADSALATLYGHFAQRSMPFGVMLGPRSRPIATSTCGRISRSRR